MTNNISRGNGPTEPQLPVRPAALRFEDEIGELARQAQRGPVANEKEHPALVACRKAAEMVRGLQERHTAEGETLARQLEQIGEDVLQMCKEAATKVREQRILPKEMSDQIADNLEHIGEIETARQTKVAAGLTAARDAIVGIDAAKDAT
jgi:hypothetical protein